MAEPTDPAQWYDTNVGRHDTLCELLRTTLEEALQGSHVNCLPVVTRRKARDSYLVKASSDKYSDPVMQIFDVVGARVVAYIPSDRDRVVHILRRCFKNIPEHSPDKAKALGVDRTGYRGVNLVCEFDDVRCRREPFASYLGQRFEIQVHTVLEHAWAQFSHQRQYKFKGLREDLDRRLNLLSGTLELIDNDFDRIATEIGEYQKELARKARLGDLSASIDSTSLQLFLGNHLAGFSPIPRANETLPTLLDELRSFGVNSVADVKTLLSPDVLQILNGKGFISITGLLRAAMQIVDLDRYFADAWKNHWHECVGRMYWSVVEKWGPRRVNSTLQRHGLEFPVRSEAIRRPRSKARRAKTKADRKGRK